jgi:hypothetical protein
MAFVGMLDQLQLSHIFTHIQLREQTGLLAIARGKQTVRLPVSGARFKKQSARGVSGRRYMALAGVLLLFVFFMQGALAWAPIQGALSAPSLPQLNAAIARAEQYISQLYKPIDGSMATVAEYYGVPLRVYLPRSHSWILLGENSSTSAITDVKNRQASETFVAEFHSSQFAGSLRIRVDVNWNEDPAHYQVRFTNEQFDDQHTSALVYLDDQYIDTFSSVNIGRSASLTYAKTDITHLHSFRYTIRHGNQLAQNYFWYKQDRDKYERLARFLTQQGYQLDYDIYAPIWGYGTAYPDDLPYQISNGDGYEAYHDCHAPSWNDTLNYLYQSKVCKVGVGIYVQVSRSDLLTISIQALHILNKYSDPKRSYVDGGNQQSTSSGRFWSSASSSTRWLNSSQLSSRSKYRPGGSSGLSGSAVAGPGSGRPPEVTAMSSPFPCR